MTKKKTQNLWLVLCLTHYKEAKKCLEDCRNCYTNRSLARFAWYTHCIITTIITRSCYLGLKSSNIIEVAAIYYCITKSSYTYLYFYIHTNMYYSKSATLKTPIGRIYSSEQKTTTMYNLLSSV